MSRSYYEALKASQDKRIKLRDERDTYRRLCHALRELIREGRTMPGLHDTTRNRQACRYDVMELARIDGELERLERGM